MKVRNILVVFIFVLIIILGILVFFNINTRKKIENQVIEDEIDYSNVDSPIVTLDIEDIGKMDIEISLVNAKNSAQNFINLVASDFYDGIKFNKKGEDFVQVGFIDKNNQKYAKVMEVMGNNNPNYYTIQGEFSQNGIENNLEIKKGTLVYARDENNKDSASFQFFICTKDTSNYDGKYAPFGFLLNGFDVLEQIDEKLQIDSKLPNLDKGNIEQENGGVTIKEAKITYCKYNVELPKYLVVMDEIDKFEQTKDEEENEEDEELEIYDIGEYDE